MESGTNGNLSTFPPFPQGPAEQETLDSGGLKCELAMFESRINWKGEIVFLSVGSKKNLDVPSHVSHDSALVLTKFYNNLKQVERTELEIRSPHIKKAFKEVVPEYKDFNLRTKSIIINDGVQYLFYYRTELQEYGRKLEDHLAIEHLVFALTYMYKALERELHTYYNFVEVSYSLPSIDSTNLWMVFRPGDYFYIKVGEVENVIKIVGTLRHERSSGMVGWEIRGQSILYDGTYFGSVIKDTNIRPYRGYKSLMDLIAKPLNYHPDKENIIERMIQRGKKYTSLHGTHDREYDGSAETFKAHKRAMTDDEDDESPLVSDKITGRIMVDGKSFFEAVPSHKPYFAHKKIETEFEEHLSLLDEEYLICGQLVPGFSLVEKRWCFFNVDRIKDVEYNMTAFESLMLDDIYKQTILSLVKVHTGLGIAFDDVIKGKGKGLIFLLHGISGVGKSLTAESIADFCKRPLYTISAGDIGTSPASMELGLGKALRLAEKWDAIILIDEADIFLEQRTTNDLVRNSLVSVLLRILEYYRGIMFLTTNRVGTFDDAFRSRVHLAIKYPALSYASRKSLWQIFLRRASPGLEWLEPEFLERLAKEDLNGRQIKNIAGIAATLAASEKSTMRVSYVETALKAMQAFDSDFTANAMEHQLENATCICGNTSKKRRIE